MSTPHPLVATTPREPTARLQPAMSITPGTQLGDFRVLSPLGAGGMSRVFLAEDVRLSRKVALKVLPPEDADDEARARFLREAQALARVTHKNVVQVFASGIDEDVAWMALEYVEGEALSSIAGDAGVDEEMALALAAQAARGLAAVHAVGVVHRDVKPDNLLLDDDAVVRVVDFGIALFVERGAGGFVTQAGVAVGTPHFMSPEQARGGAVDARADAWGLGATLFSLLTGRPPFFVKDDEADLEILARVLRDSAPDVRAARPGVSPATSGLLARLLAADPAQRPSDMNEIADALEAIADALASGEAPPPSPVLASSSQPPTDEAAGEIPAAAVPAAAPASRPTGPSSARVVALAVLFSALGALVAFQIARSVTAPPPPEPPPPLPPVAEPTPPPPEPPPAAPEPPPPPTADDLASRIIADASDTEALQELVARNDNDARAAVVRVASVQGASGDVMVLEIARARALHHIGAVERALMVSKKSRARRIIDALVEWRPFEAIALLERVSRAHADPLVRAQALAARETLFKVE